MNNLFRNTNFIEYVVNGIYIIGCVMLANGLCTLVESNNKNKTLR